MISDPLQHLEAVLQEVYLPLLANPSNQEGWGETASKEILDQLHGFLANVSITLGQTKVAANSPHHNTIQHTAITHTLPPTPRARPAFRSRPW